MEKLDAIATGDAGRVMSGVVVLEDDEGSFKSAGAGLAYGAAAAVAALARRRG